MGEMLVRVSVQELRVCVLFTDDGLETFGAQESGFQCELL
jgi:hypothetical protein